MQQHAVPTETWIRSHIANLQQHAVPSKIANDRQ